VPDIAATRARAYARTSKTLFAAKKSEGVQGGGGEGGEQGGFSMKKGGGGGLIASSLYFWKTLVKSFPVSERTVS